VEGEEEKGHSSWDWKLWTWAAVLSPFVFCFWFLVIQFFLTQPFSVPEPYPGVATEEASTGFGNCGNNVITYTVDVSIDDMQQYYEAQMTRYCAQTELRFLTTTLDTDWQFEIDTYCPDHEECRSAECFIGHVEEWPPTQQEYMMPLVAQHFFLKLLQESENQTLVIQDEYICDTRF
jgi:hypothetical protein